MGGCGAGLQRNLLFLARFYAMSFVECYFGYGNHIDNWIKVEHEFDPKDRISWKKDCFYLRNRIILKD